MFRKKRPEDLTVEELRRLLVEKRRATRQDRLEYFDFFSRQTLPGIVATNVLKRPGKSLALAEKECQVAKSPHIALCPMNPNLEEAVRPIQPDGGHAN